MSIICLVFSFKKFRENQTTYLRKECCRFSFGGALRNAVYIAPVWRQQRKIGFNSNLEVFSVKTAD